MLADGFESFEESSGADAARVQDAARELEPERWRRRAHLKFAGEAGAKQVEELLRSRSGLLKSGVEERPLQSVIYLEGGAPLELANLSVHGQLVIVSDGPVHLSDVTLADPESDRLVVQASGPLSVAGTVQAALIARGPFVGAPDARVKGLLVMQRLDAGSRLEGRVDHDGDRHDLGADGADRAAGLTVVMSPLVQRRIGR